MTFTLDKRIAETTSEIAEWPLSKVLFKNDKNYPWFLLVPRRAEITEIFQLSVDDQSQLMREISQLSDFVQQHFSCQKINVAAIGNQVPQLHVHVVGRNKKDSLWPASIWQPAYVADEYSADELQTVLSGLAELKLVF